MGVARVSLVSVASQYVHSALAPWCLVAGLKAYARGAFEAVVLEGTVNEAPRRLLEEIVASRPDVLGFSCYIWNVGWVARLLPLVRAALPGAWLVLGGPEVGHRAADALNRMPEADFVLCGEGELPFARLVDAWQGLAGLEEVPGLVARGQMGAGVIHQHHEMQPSPYSADYFRALGGRIAYLETSRGCPYACAFCLSGRGERLRQAPLETRVFPEVLALARSGARTIKLVDRTFNADRARARRIMAFMAAEHGRGIPRGVTFHFEVAGDLLDEETIALVAASPKGLFQFEIGLQSMDERTLRLSRRQTDLGHLTQQVRRLIATGKAHVHLDLIAGLPGEGLDQFIRGFNQAFALRPQALQLGFLKLLHGSAMREQPETYPCAFDPEPPYQVRSTPCMGADDFAVLARAERALDKLHNSGRFQGSLAWLTDDQLGPGIPAFQLFERLGGAIQRQEAQGGSLSLDGLTETVHQALTAWLPGEAALIRDMLLRDRLASTPTTVLPACLKRPDARYHAAKRALARRHPRPTGTQRAIGFLYAGTADQVIWCDYTEKDPVTGLYEVSTLTAEELLSQGPASPPPGPARPRGAGCAGGR